MLYRFASFELDSDLYVLRREGAPVRVVIGPTEGRIRLSLTLRQVSPDGAEDAVGLGTFELPLLADGGLAEYVRVREAVAHAVITSLTPFHSLPAEIVPPPRNAEAYVLTYAGFLERAQARLQRVLELDPWYFSTGAYATVPGATLYLGRWQEFLDLVPE